MEAVKIFKDVNEVDQYWLSEIARDLTITRETHKDGKVNVRASFNIVDPKTGAIARKHDCYWQRNATIGDELVKMPYILDDVLLRVGVFEHPEKGTLIGFKWLAVKDTEGNVFAPAGDKIPFEPVLDAVESDEEGDAE